MTKYLRVTMPDGSSWDVPVGIIACHRAEAYADEFGGDVKQSLEEDTLPLFEEASYEISDWAANNMNWSDVASIAQRVLDSLKPKVDYEEGWINGEKKVVEY